jgi:hypothetical protein
MTAKASTTRLIIYVLISMATAAGAGIMSVDFTNERQVAAWSRHLHRRSHHRPQLHRQL